VRPEWEYVPEGWSRPARGWDAPAVEAAYRRRWPEFVAAVQGTGPLGIAHEVPEHQSVVRDDPGWHNAVLTFGYVLALAARDNRVSVLDWGGGPGHYYVLARALLRGVELDYHSRDLPRLAAFGREVLPDATFHDDDSCLERTYDLVVASDSLQYAPQIEHALGRLAGAAAPWLFVAQLPVVKHAAAFVVLQRPDAYGYDTEYLGWVLNRTAFVEAAMAAGLHLEREFIAPGTIAADGAPETAYLRSFLFRRS
jgi:putative methyltransferase (TIGR04325 family)